MMQRRAGFTSWSCPIRVCESVSFASSRGRRSWLDRGAQERVSFVESGVERTGGLLKSCINIARASGGEEGFLGATTRWPLVD